MSIKDAIEKVLREVGRPLPRKEIAERILAKGLWHSEGKTPEATVAATIYMSISKGEKRFAKAGKGLFMLYGKKLEGKDSKSRADDAGYVYILTNPCFRRDWVKIGKTERPVNVRSKELDNTAIPLPFEIYAILKTCQKTAIEQRFHGLLDALDEKWRVRKNREFFKVEPARALRCLREIAMLVHEEGNITLGKDIVDENCDASVCEREGKRGGKQSSKPLKNSWNGKTQLAKLIAIQGGKEGAFGGILQYFAAKGAKARKPCRTSSKWRKLLEDAGVKFDDDDFVSDWKHARNPL